MNAAVQITSGGWAFPVEAMGWAAAALTLATFICRDMRRLRLLALAANAAFIAYGASAQLWPVLMLHLLLVPVNLVRLNQAFRSRTPAQTPDTPSHRAPAGPATPADGGRPPMRRRPRTWRSGARVRARQPRAGGPSSVARAASVTASAHAGSTPSARIRSKSASPSAVRAADSAADTDAASSDWRVSAACA